MIKGITFEYQNVTSKIDGGFYNRIFTGDGIIRGCPMTATAKQLTIQPGLMIIAGRLIWVDSATSFTIGNTISNGYAALIFTIDLSKTASPTEFEQISADWVYSATTAFPELTRENINAEGGDTVYQAQIAVVNIAGGNIASITSSIGGAQLNAQLLGGKVESQLNVAQAANASKLNNKNESQLTVYDSARLGGLAASGYALKADLGTHYLYVNVNGSDAPGRGTTDAPYKTLQYAYDNIPDNWFGEVIIMLSDGNHDYTSSDFTAFQNSTPKNISRLTISGTDSMNPSIANGSRFHGMFQLYGPQEVFIRGVTIMPPYANFASRLIAVANAKAAISNSRIMGSVSGNTFTSAGIGINVGGNSQVTMDEVLFERVPNAIRANGSWVILQACSIGSLCTTGLQSLDGAILSFSGTNSATGSNYTRNGVLFVNGTIKS